MASIHARATFCVNMCPYPQRATLSSYGVQSGDDHGSAASAVAATSATRSAASSEPTSSESAAAALAAAEPASTEPASQPAC